MIAGHPAKVVLPIDRLTELFEASESGIEQACEEHREALDKDFRYVCSQRSNHSLMHPEISFST